MDNESNESSESIRKTAEKALADKPDIDVIYRLIGAKINSVRDALGWTQEDLAMRTNMSRSSIANIELGNQRILLGDVEKFAKAFHTTPKHLMRGIWF